MPAEPLELWKSQPFEPEVRDGRIWARGADDDKGQSMIQVKAFEYLVREGLLRHNVKFIFEGEEEIGSPSLNAFLKAHKELLKADVILVSDTSMLGADLPSLTTGLRGLAYWEIEVTGPNRDLHSGHFGGAVANPINVLCDLLSKVIDADGRITVPHFYDDVEEVPAAEREMIAQIPFDEKKYMEAIGVKALKGEKGYSTLERNSCRPSFDVCGIWGGYTGEGSKTVLPSKAYAKVSSRLVPHQQHEKISQLFVDYLTQQAPDYVQVKVTPLHGGEGYVCPIDHPAYQAAEKGFEKAFGKKPLAVRRGGSIPIISDFEQILGDHAVNISKVANEISEKKITFSESAQKELSVLEAAVREIVDLTVDAFCEDDLEMAAKIEPLRELIGILCNDLKNRHVTRLREGKCEFRQGFAFNDLLTNLERIAAHCSNVAVAMIETETSEFDTHEYLKSVRHMKDDAYLECFDSYARKYSIPPTKKEKKNK
jgi:acetylornithine deacetylase/succinyl-diaminopimelate desuccinylase-like protein